MFIPSLGFHVKVPVLPACRSAAREGICCLPSSLWGSLQAPLRTAYSSISFSDNIGDLSGCIARFSHTECHTQIGAKDTLSHYTLAHIIGICRYFNALLGGEILERHHTAFKYLLYFTNLSLQSPKLTDSKMSTLICLAVMEDNTCERFLWINFNCFVIPNVLPFSEKKGIYNKIACWGC